MMYVFKLNERDFVVTEEILFIMERNYHKEVKVERIGKRVRLTASKQLVKTFVNDQIYTSGEINWTKAAKEAIAFIIEDATCAFVHTLRILTE